MTTSAANEKLIGDLFAAVGSDDWVAVEKLITPDFRFIESPSLPVAGTYTGLREYQAFYRSVREGAGTIDADFISMTSSETHVVALLILHFKDHGVSTPIAETFKIRDGRVCEIMPFFYNANDVTKVFAGVPAIYRQKLGR